MTVDELFQIIEYFIKELELMDVNYPIVLGHRFKKGLLAFRHGEEGFSFLICRLKKEYQTGDRFEFKDIESVEKEIWFTDRESLEMTVGLMKKVLKDWRN